MLSYLLRALQAPIEDRELARLGNITTRELARRARSSGARQNSIQREAVAFDRECAAVRSANAIQVWFDQQKVPSADREQIIDQASLLQVSVKKVDLGSLEASLPDIPLTVIIRLLRPADLPTDENHTILWFARWLSDWTHHGILDETVRVRALELARGEFTP